MSSRLIFTGYDCTYITLRLAYCFRADLSEDSFQLRPKEGQPDSMP